MERRLRKGDIVKVYDSPITDEGYEGVAVLVAPITDVDPATGCQDWFVRFLYEDGDYRRTVHPRHRKG